IDGEIGAHKISVRFALQRDIFQAQLQAGDFAFVSVSNQPVIGITAVVTFLENARRIVDGGGILHGLAGADEFGHAVGVESVKTGDRGLGNDHARGIDAKIVTAVDEPGQAVHNEVIAARGGNVEGYGPARAV